MGMLRTLSCGTSRSLGPAKPGQKETEGSVCGRKGGENPTLRGQPDQRGYGIRPPKQPKTEHVCRHSSNLERPKGPGHRRKPAFPTKRIGQTSACSS